MAKSMLPGYSSLLGQDHTEVIGEITRGDFDEDFIFGSATSAYQFEGAYDEDGKGPSVWDSWTRLRPDKVDGGTNGNVAVDHYHLYKDDIQMMKKTGLEAYRFSISWPRILPGGKIDSGTNKKGIEYYNNLIDDLIANGIEPCVTLFHWDLPLALEYAYGGFLSGHVVQDFVDYAGLCFWEFGDRVKTWITFNEGWTYCNFGYNAGTFPPGRGTDTTNCKTKYKYCAHKGAGCYIAEHCTNGDAGTEPYIAAHNMILAHAYAVQLYRTEYQEIQGGKIGITNNFHFFEPLSDTDDDRKACIRGIDWMFGWFTAPVTTGDYPLNMRETCGDRLPKFSKDEVKLVKGSYDFIGLNYYTTRWATLIHKHPDDDQDTFQSDRGIIDSSERTLPNGNKERIGDPTGAEWQCIVARGLYNALVYGKQTYNIDLFYITENGCADFMNPKDTPTKARNDQVRVRYFREHLWYLKKAIREAKVNVKQYFLWSLGDNFEWAQGYTYRFGTFYIDFVDGQLTRIPKSSAIWWRKFFGRKYTTIPKGSLEGDAAAMSEKAHDDSSDAYTVPEDIRNILSRSVEGAESLLKKFSCEKDLYLYLSENPILIDDGRKSFWLDKGKKCYMVGSKDIRLGILLFDIHWRVVSLPASRFTENMELVRSTDFPGFEGKIMIGKLSPDTRYVAYLVYSPKFLTGFKNIGVEAFVCMDTGFATNRKTNNFIYLDPGVEPRMLRTDVNVKLPKQRGDSFFEIELGEYFVNGEYKDKILLMGCKHEKQRMYTNIVKKAGLIIEGIEIRPQSN